jgi:diguanylate cyclase
MLFFIGYQIMKQLTMDSACFKLFIRRPLLIALSVHGLFLLLFIILRIPVLITAHAVSLCFCILALWLLRSVSFKAIAVLAWIDLISQALISSEVLGWQSGFLLYLLLLLPITFLYEIASPAKRAFLVEFALACYLLLDYHFFDQPPMIVVHPLIALLIRYMNVLICFGGLSYLLHFHISYWQEYKRALPLEPETDQLTGLHNRQAMLLKIDEILSSASIHKQHMSLIVADIDNFKILNEQYGHNTGDAMLVYVAQILHDSIRHNDRASRWGGGEFLVLLPGGSLQSAEQIAQRVQEKLQSKPLKSEGKTISVFMTLGVAELLPDEDFNQCLVRADMALRRGKENGRNRIELAGASAPEPTSA